MGQTLGTFVAREHHEDMLALSELIRSGEDPAGVDRADPLAEAPRAIRDMEQGHARGKVVLTV